MIFVDLNFMKSFADINEFNGGMDVITLKHKQLTSVLCNTLLGNREQLC